MKSKILFVILLVFVPIIASAEEVISEEPITVKDVKYYKTTNINGLSLNEELTEAEYNAVNVDAIPVPFATSGGAYSETTYKKLELNILKIGSQYDTSVSVLWKKIPVTKSYDVIAIRAEGMRIITNSQYGEQVFYRDGVRDVVGYSYNGTNINKKTNGYGISMNLVNGNTTYYYLYTNASFAKDGSGNGMIYATYQHATSDVTLDQSKNYNISAAGLGGVVYFYDGLAAKYDNMPGAKVVIDF